MKDIDKLQKKSRKLRNFAEKSGSTGLAISGLIGLLFLGVLIWQIAEPTIIRGEQGDISASSEAIPVTSYILKWDSPNVDSETGDVMSEPIVIRIQWEEGDGEQSHDLRIDVLDEKGLTVDVNLSEDGLDADHIQVGYKTKFYILSTLDVPATVQQISGPVPDADETGYPEVDSFVTSVDLHILFDDNNEAVFEPLELLAWISLLITIIIMIWPNENILKFFSQIKSHKKLLKIGFYILAIITLVLSIPNPLQAFGDELPGLSAILAALCWAMIGVILFRLIEGIERLENIGRSLSETSRLKHSISNRDGLMMWSKMILVTSMLFIPILIDIPFITERYANTLVPYASGIRAAFYGTIWVMVIAMIVSIPISVGAAIYLEEYAKPTQTTKLIQALVTNLAGVPSIVFGMFGLAIFVKQGGIGWGLGPSILAAGLTMGVMAMPIIVLAGQEALRSVPRSLRESAYGVGCTRWQVTKDHVLPSAMPGIMTGSILAMSRIMGEAAPLVVVGAAAMVLFDPEPLAGLSGSGQLNFTVIPIQIYFWTSEPGAEWHSLAAVASITLIGLLIAMNSIAIVLRQHFRRRLNS